MAPVRSLQETEALYQKATRAELDKSFDLAFETYIAAAQSYLHFVRNATNERERMRWKAGAQKCLERAERIKAAKKDLAPLAKNPFSQEEQSYVIEKSSHIHALRFSVWPAEFGPDRPPDSEVYIDPDGQPPLAPSTTESVPTWRRPHDVHSDIVMASPALLPDEIIQNVITDCSVCTSIAVCLQHHRRFDSKVGFNGVYPQDPSGLPRMAPNGRYAIRIFINGAYRKLVIDDHLPFYSDGRPIFVSTSPMFDLWPGLMEKAYMKLMGGYDFPGSNSSIDIHAMTGWIPEQFEIQSSTFESEKTWSRLTESYSKGHCILTVGTGQRDPGQLSIGGMQVLPTHSYAVVDMREDNGERWFTILDPWASCFPPGDGEPLDVGLSNLDINRRNRGVDITWNDVCAFFEGIYVNWDPALLQHRLDFHGLWRPKSEKSPAHSVHSHLWFNSEGANAGDEVWVLLTRHIVDKRRQSEYIAIHVQEEEAMGGVSSARKTVLKGTYTSSTHVLARYTMMESTGRVAVVASYDGEYDDVGFTVQVFSSTKLSWITESREPVYSQVMQGVFSSKNAGGNSMYPSFMHNPQYRLRHYPGKKTMLQGTKAGSKTSIRLVVEGPRDVPLNVTMVWSRGERTFDLAHGDILANSGPYSFGIAHAMTSISAGEYNIIVSAFEPRHRGQFSLLIESSERMDVEQIPSEGAGMFCKNVRGAWDSSTAGGGPTFGKYNTNPAYDIDVQSSTTMKIRLQLTKPSSDIALNVTMFSVDSDDNLGRQVATSGPYSDAISGVVTPQVPVAPGKYRVIPSIYDPGINAAFQLFLFTKTSDVHIAPKR